MKKINKCLLIIALLSLALLAGCSTQATEGQQKDYYVPNSNAGCALQEPVTEQPIKIIQKNVEQM